MALLRVSLMGPFQVTLEGQLVTAFESNKVRALLAYLAVERGRAHPRETLAGLLWPETPQPSALAYLRHALADLRRVIGDRQADPPYLTITRTAIQLNPAADIQVDVSLFEELIDRGPEISALEAAIALQRGPFLDGFACDSAAFEEWVLTRRERLARQQREALGRLAALHAGAGEHEESVRWARQLLELEPWDEAGHRLVMAGLAQAGQRSAALGQYEICRRRLKEELNVEPGAETQALYERIRSGELSATADQEVVITKKEVAPRHNLPAGLSVLIGRERELEEIAVRLRDPHCRLLTVVGPGGIGKTHMVLEAAARQVERWRDGVYLVSLAPLRSVDSIPAAIAGALGFNFYPEGEPTQQLLGYLRHKEMLLMLDNFEHLLEGAGLVVEILRAAPGVKILVTSRARLNLRDEQLFPLEGLDFPEPRYEEAGQYAAVQLFLERARRVRPHYAAAEGEWEAIGQICQEVQGMPLAILLAASWMALLSPGEIAREIASRSLDFLEAEWQDVPARQRSLRAVFDYSWKLLSRREQEIFAGLSVFRGGFTLSTAQAVTGVTLRELLGLVEKALVQRGADGRYDLHELLRQYATEILDRTPGLCEAIQERHCACFAAALQEWREEFKGPRQFAAAAEMNVEFENVRAAWRWMVAHTQVERIDQAVSGLGSLYDLGLFYGRWGVAKEAAALFKEAADGLAPLVLASPGAYPAGARVLARVLTWQVLCSYGGDAQSEALLERGTALLEQAAAAGENVRPEKAFLLFSTGYLLLMSPSKGDPLPLMTESLALYHELGDRRMVSRMLAMWGNYIEAHLANYNEARQMHEQSLAIARELGDQSGILRSLFELEFVAWLQGRLGESERLVRESLPICQESGIPSFIAGGVYRLGEVFMRQGRFAEGAPLLAEAVALGEQGSEFYCHDCLILGELEAHQGQYAQARDRGQAGLAFCRENLPDHVWLNGSSLFLLGLTALGLEQCAEARGHLEESVVFFRKRWVEYLGWNLALLACAERGLGRPAQAGEHLLEALRLGIEKGMFFTLLYALPAACLLLAERGKLEKAVETYATALRYGFVANSRWFEDVVGREMAALAAGLPAEVAAAARERGQDRDLFATAEELLVEFDQ